MRTPMLTAVLAIAALPLAAQKQAGAPAAVKTPASAVGTWEGKTMLSNKDSVVTTFRLVLNADGTGTQNLPGRPPITERVIAAGGDSVVIQSTRYNSVLHPKLTVTTQTTLHVKGNSASGHTRSSYSDGTKGELKTSATRKQ